MTEINDDNITKSDIESAYKVLEQLREEFEASDMLDSAQLVNGSHYQVQMYEAQSEWREDKPSDRIDQDNFKTLCEMQDNGEC